MRLRRVRAAYPVLQNTTDNGRISVASTSTRSRCAGRQGAVSPIRRRARRAPVLTPGRRAALAPQAPCGTVKGGQLAGGGSRGHLAAAQQELGRRGRRLSSSRKVGERVEARSRAAVVESWPAGAVATNQRSGGWPGAAAPPVFQGRARWRAGRFDATNWRIVFRFVDGEAVDVWT